MKFRSQSLRVEDKKIRPTKVDWQWYRFYWICFIGSRYFFSRLVSVLEQLGNKTCLLWLWVESLGSRFGSQRSFAKVVAKLQLDVYWWRQGNATALGVLGVTSDWPLNFGNSSIIYGNYLLSTVARKFPSSLWCLLGEVDSVVMSVPLYASLGSLCLRGKNCFT